jgi:hypothetical protein
MGWVFAGMWSNVHPLPLIKRPVPFTQTRLISLKNMSPGEKLGASVRIALENPTTNSLRIGSRLFFSAPMVATDAIKLSFSPMNTHDPRVASRDPGNYLDHAAQSNIVAGRANAGAEKPRTIDRGPGDLTDGAELRIRAQA